MKKRDLKVKDFIVLIFIIICVIGLIYSVINIIKWQIDNNKTAKMQKKLQKNITVKKSKDKEKSILDNYSINFDELKKINPEVVGYINVGGTNIESTIVKHNDNNYYLNHSFDNTWNQAGWTFSDFRNRYDGTDKNFVIFGHSRKDGSLFGSLKNILTKEWQDGNNKIIFITENSKNMYEVFSVYKIKVEDYYITTDFYNDYEFEKFINDMKLRSYKDFNVNVTTNDTLLTLSTCDDNNSQYRVVLHAKKVLKN